jgi:hypothetical protein
MESIETSLRDRRLENEWALLLKLCEMNHGHVGAPCRKPDGEADEFSITLNHTGALVRNSCGLRVEQRHMVRFRYPRFYPAVSIEAYISPPVFHPNVHPESGFVCLWDRYAAGDSILEAIRQLQRVITWALMNSEARHLLQPDALIWHRDAGRATELPLDCKAIASPESFDHARAYRPPGTPRPRRLF